MKTEDLQEGKLIKLELAEGYRLNDSNGNIIGSTLDGGKHKLSLPNCQAIERGYDLGELANKHIKEWDYENTLGKGQSLLAHDNFIMGFQKALELMEDKKFTEEDVRKAYDTNHLSQECKDNGRESFIQSLQQTEWDVVIEMEKYGFCEGCRRSGMWHCAHADSCGNAIELERPKLDENGCLILKRK